MRPPGRRLDWEAIEAWALGPLSVRGQEGKEDLAKDTKKKPGYGFLEAKGKIGA